MNQTLLKIEAQPADISHSAPANSPPVGKLSMPLKRHASAVDWVHGALLRAIVSLRLVPGEKLSRKVLAKWLGVSATPVRDALLRLDAQGLVETKAQSETRVRLLHAPELHSLQFERVAMETEIAHRLARRAGPPLHAARAGLWALETATRTGLPDAPRDAVALDLGFHALLFEAAGMGDAFDRFRSRAAPLERCLNIVPATGNDVVLACDFHRQILDRIDAGDGKGAAAAMRAHLADDAAVIGRAQRMWPDWFG